MKRLTFAIIALITLAAVCTLGGSAPKLQPEQMQPLEQHLGPINDAWRGHYLSGHDSPYTYLDVVQTYNIAVVRAELNVLRNSVMDLNKRLQALEDPNKPGDPNDGNNP